MSAEIFSCMLSIIEIEPLLKESSLDEQNFFIYKKNAMFSVQELAEKISAVFFFNLKKL